MEQPTLPPPTEQDLAEVASYLESRGALMTDAEKRVAQFLRLLAPQMAMFASMLPPQG